MARAHAVWRLAGGAFLLLLAVAGTAQALSCMPPPSDWAELRVTDVDTGLLEARVPFTGHEPGYGCNVGNLHALGGDWLAWTQEDVGERLLRLVDLSTGKDTTVQVDRPVPAGMSVAEPHVFLLRGPEAGHWTVERHAVDPGSRDASRSQTLLEGTTMVLGGHHVHALTGDRHAPRLYVFDAAGGRTVQEPVPLPTPAGTRGDWRLLAGDGTWVVLASDVPADHRGTMLPEAARLWLHRVGDERLHALGPPGDRAEHRFGAFALDGDHIYYEVWEATLPWFPGQLVRRTVPDGPPQEVAGSGGLMRGVVVDADRLVTGRYLEEAPASRSPWIAPDTQTTPVGPTEEPESEGAPALAPALVAAAVLGSAATLRRRRQAAR